MWRIYNREESEPLEKLISSYMEKAAIKEKSNIDIIDFCGRLGFKVMMLPLSKNNLDGIIVADKDEKIIAVDDKLDFKRARFVIAHELSHYIYEIQNHKDTHPLIAARDKIYHDLKKKPIEHNMDYLAAAILVPKDQFIEDLKDINLATYKDANEAEIRKNLDNDTVLRLSQKYIVEPEVIIKRIAEVSYYV